MHMGTIYLGRLKPPVCRYGFQAGFKPVSSLCKSRDVVSSRGFKAVSSWFQAGFKP